LRFARYFNRIPETFMAQRATALKDGQFVDVNEAPCSTESLLERFREFCFPGGRQGAARVHAVRIAEKGEMRTSPQARWIPFTAEETISAIESDFCWSAHLNIAKVLPVTVVDAYQQHHGRLLAKVGPLTTQSVAGPDADRGEVQRYLASIIYCPAMLLNHRSLEWTAAGPLSLLLRDREDTTGATVEIEISENGKPLACRAYRPRLVGKHTILTPWMARCSNFREHEGMRVACGVEASWLVDGWFPYFRSEITWLDVVE
jgi:hypothetical protein